MSEPRLEKMLNAIINDTKYTEPPTCVLEEILKAIIDGEEYTNPPTCRLDDLMLQIKEKIEKGGGGLSETLLWQNPNTRVEFTYVELPTGVWQDYTYIKVVYQNSTSLTSQLVALASVESIQNQLKAFPSNASYGNWVVGRGDANSNYKRGVMYQSTGKWQIIRCNGLWDSKDYTTQLIPVAVYGLK